MHVLFEHAAGYALFAVKEVEEIGMLLPQVGLHSWLLLCCSSLFSGWSKFEMTASVFQVEESVLSIGKFNSMVSLAAFFPFKSAQAALENMNAISEGKWTSFLGLLIGVLSCDDVFIICQSTELLC